jgi:hypothetical protein
VPVRLSTGKTNVQRQRHALSRRGRSQPCDQVSQEAITAAAKRAVVAWSLVSVHTVPEFIACLSQSPCVIQTWSETRWRCRCPAMARPGGNDSDFVSCIAFIPCTSLSRSVCVGRLDVNDPLDSYSRERRGVPHPPCILWDVPGQYILNLNLNLNLPLPPLFMLTQGV